MLHILGMHSSQSYWTHNLKLFLRELAFRKKDACEVHCQIIVKSFLILNLNLDQFSCYFCLRSIIRDIGYNRAHAELDPFWLLRFNLSHIIKRLNHLSYCILFHIVILQLFSNHVQHEENDSANKGPNIDTGRVMTLGESHIPVHLVVVDLNFVSLETHDRLRNQLQIDGHFLYAFSLAAFVIACIRAIGTSLFFVVVIL